jgi:hypothetical protein
MATSIIFAFLPYFADYISDSPLVDFVFLGLALLVGSFAFRQGFKRHKRLLPAVLFGSGLLTIVLAHVILAHAHAGESTGLVSVRSLFSLIGGVLLITAHWLNTRLAREACCDNLLCHHQQPE